MFANDADDLLGLTSIRPGKKLKTQLLGYKTTPSLDARKFSHPHEVADGQDDRHNNHLLRRSEAFDLDVAVADLRSHKQSKHNMSMVAGELFMTAAEGRRTVVCWRVSWIWYKTPKKSYHPAVREKTTCKSESNSNTTFLSLAVIRAGGGGGYGTHVAKRRRTQTTPFLTCYGALIVGATYIPLASSRGAFSWPPPCRACPVGQKWSKGRQRRHVYSIGHIRAVDECDIDEIFHKTARGCLGTGAIRAEPSLLPDITVL